MAGSGLTLAAPPPGLLDSTDEHLVDCDATLPAVRARYAAMSERVRPVSQVPRTAKAAEPEWPRSVRRCRPAASITCASSCSASPAGPSSACPVNRAAQIVWTPGQPRRRAHAVPPPGLDHRPVRRPAAAATAAGRGGNCRRPRSRPPPPGVPGLLRRGRVHERHVGRRGGGDQVVEQQRGPLPGPPVQRGAGEHVVDRVGPRQIAHRQPAQHGGCRARPGSANRWSGFGRSSSSRPRPKASCLPQLVTNQRPVLDQLVFVKLHHHARTLLAHPCNQESRYSFAAGDSFLTDTPCSRSSANWQAKV